MPRNAIQRQLTELEGAALGCVLRAGRCTAYTVRRSFATSPSAFWSGSAGTVYPLIRRLERRGLLASQADRRDRRATRWLTISAAGRRAFEAWLLDARRAADYGFDPLRTRLFYSDLVAPARVDAFIAETRIELASGSPPPRPDLPHVVALHESWAALRRSALEDFHRVGKRLRAGR